MTYVFVLVSVFTALMIVGFEVLGDLVVWSIRKIKELNKGSGKS